MLNTLVVFFTFSEWYDLIIYIGLTVFIVGNFQKNDKLMRKQMMLGTFLIIFYNIFIFSPMGVIAESVFLIGNITGYYRHYIRKDGSRNGKGVKKKLKCINKQCDEK